MNNSVKTITVSKPIRDTIKYLSNGRTAYLLYNGNVYATIDYVCKEEMAVMKSSYRAIYVAEDRMVVDMHMFLSAQY